jgi:glycosyltransferase involved in cell wall biosynthesis
VGNLWVVFLFDIVYTNIRIIDGMKICIINNIYPPYDRGGAEQVIKKAIEGLLDAHHEVFLLTSSPDGESIEQKGNLTIYRTKPKNIFFYTDAHKYNALSRLLWHMIDILHISTAIWVRRKIIEIKPDIIHTHNLMGLSFLIPKLLKKFKIKHIHTVHDVQLVEPSGLILKEKDKSWRYTGLPIKIYAWIMKKFIGSPDVVISPSQFLLNFYKKWGFFDRSHCYVLRNPITFDMVVAKEKKKEKKTKFLYLGQIEDHKGVFMMVESFKLLNKNNAELHIVGFGSKFEMLKKVAKEYSNIFLHGYVEREQLPKLFAKMDIAIVPSICYENSPTVIFESFYFGLPVISSDIEGIAELIKEGDNGFTFETGNISLLIHRMEWCLHNKEKVKEMSKKTSKALIGLSLEEYIKKLEDLYRH